MENEQLLCECGKGTDADISIGEGVRHHNAKYYPVLICSFVKIVAEHGDNLAAAR